MYTFVSQKLYKQIIIPDNNMNTGDKVANDGGKKVAIYTLTSELHDENAVASVLSAHL